MSKLKKIFKLIIIPASVFFLVGLFFVTSFAMNGNNNNPISKLQLNAIQNNADINDEPGNFAELQTLLNDAGPGATIALQKDYLANDGEDGIVLSKDYILDLNGHTINRALSEPKLYGYVFQTRFKLTITDSNNQGYTGLITGGNNTQAGGCIECLGNNAALTIKGENVLIGGNHSESNGGAIYFEGQKIDIQNCRIGGKIGEVVYGNSANYDGGAICCSSSECSISGGSICQNTSSKSGAIAIFKAESSLHMTGGTISENVAKGVNKCYGGAIYCEGNFDMTGGVISNNTAKEGGGVYTASGTINGANAKIVDNKADKGGAIFLNTGTFNIINGTIGEDEKPNIATQEGGGIFNNEATLNISGGSISYNECKSENQDCYGGGIVNKTTKAKTNITGGIFTNNKCNSSTGAYGGAICVNEGECSISGTSVDISGNTSSKYGGAVYFDGGSLNLNDCTIGKETTPNKANENGAGVYVATNDHSHLKISGNLDIRNNKKRDNSSSNVYLGTGSKIEIDEEVGIDEKLKVGVSCQQVPTVENPVTIVIGHGEDFEKFLADDEGWKTLNNAGNICLTKDWMTFKGLQSQFDNASTDSENPTTIKLYCDVVAESSEAGLNLPENRYVILDLKGYKIDRGLTSPKDDGYVISNSGDLTIIDSNTKGDIGLITGGNNEENGGGIHCSPYSALTINGGHVLIGGNHSGADGGAISSEGGKVNIQNGQIGGKIGEQIYENSAAYHGGAIYCSECSVSGGSICHNTATDGGGVYCVNNFNMTGGVISYNAAQSKGGGVCSLSEFIMTSTRVDGGEISHNTASLGAGLYGKSGKISTSVPYGSPDIVGNKADQGGGIYLTGEGNFYVQAGNIGTEPNPNIAKEGGGIYQNSQTNLFITGGSISHNIAQSEDKPSYGGGLFSNGTTKISEGSLCYNKCGSESQKQSAGGAVYVGGGECSVSSKFSHIWGNTSDYGGGFYLKTGLLMLESCPIGIDSNPNKATVNGAGVYVGSDKTSSHFIIAGDIDITDNEKTDSSPNNVYLSEGRVIEIDEKKGIGKNLDVGVTCQQAPTEENPVLIVNGHSKDFKKFSSDNTNYEVIRENGKIYLANYKKDPNADWKGLQDNINKGGDVTLTKDIVFDWSREEYTKLHVPSGQTVNLIMNDHSINANIKEAEYDGHVINNEGNLTITNGTITGGFSTTDNAGIWIHNSGKLTVSGKVIINDNKSVSEGRSHPSNAFLELNDDRNNFISASDLKDGSYIGVTNSFGAWVDGVKISDAEVGYAKFFHSDEGNGSIATYSKDYGLYLSTLKTDADGIINGYTRKYNNEYDLKIPYTINALDIIGIADSVFKNDKNIRSVDIPETITSIGAGAFSGCTNLIKFIINSNNPNYVAGQVGANYPMLLSKASNEQILYAYPSANGDIEIPEAITDLDAKAFEGCENLTSVFFKGDRPEDEGLNALLADRSLAIKYHPTNLWCDNPKPEGDASWYPVISNYNHFANFLSSPYCSGETADVNENLNFLSTSGKVLTVESTDNKWKTVKFGESVSLNIGNNSIELKKGAQLKIEGGKISGHTVASKSFNTNQNTNALADPNKFVKEPDWAVYGTDKSNSNAVATIYDGTVIHNMNEATLSIDNTIFESNNITYGSIYNNGTLSLNNCKFYNNNSVYDGTEYVAGGACLFNSGTATVANTNFGDSTHENKAVLYGGAIANISKLSLESCNITNCSAKFGGGIFNSRNVGGSLVGDITIKQSHITANKAGGDGVACAGAGILCVNNTRLTLGEYMQIFGNMRGQAKDNICLGRPRTEGYWNLISFTDDFSILGSNKIGITTETKPTLDCPVLICETNRYSDMFVSDNDAYEISGTSKFTGQMALVVKNQLNDTDNLHSAIDKAVEKSKKFDMNKTIDSAKSLYGNIVDKFRIVLGKERS
ncbi:MAG: leucine-rich repeat protein [Coriobacteriia bacterium]|nr:leucine-rich repeat protein [Coriobacteriia bacterium]